VKARPADKLEDKTVSRGQRMEGDGEGSSGWAGYRVERPSRGVGTVRHCGCVRELC